MKAVIEMNNTERLYGMARLFPDKTGKLTDFINPKYVVTIDFTKNLKNLKR